MSGTHVTYEGKTYLKKIVLAQANAALKRGTLFILPPGVVFKAHTGPDIPWLVLKKLPFEGRFLVQPAEPYNAAHPLHGLAKAVREVVDLPDECPPVSEWEQVGAGRERKDANSGDGSTEEDDR